MNDEVPSFGKILWWFVCAFVVLTVVGGGLTWLVQGNDFFLYKYFGPRMESVRREVFENTKSYKQGMVQDLLRMQEEYIKADKDHKIALSSMILHRSADFPEDQMPADLRSFIWGLKKERGLAR